MECFDVLVVGAGLSGIGAAYYLQRDCPRKSYAILEARGAIGGTWDLFRYPGIRSDSDMFTLGYAFKPWLAAKAIADGPSILSYVRETAREHNIEKHIRFHHKVVRADWSSSEAQWQVEVEISSDDGAPPRLTKIACQFLYMCSGYYDYAQGHRPDFAGEGDFKGRIVHPQFWPNDLDYRGKKVVVIGSGATAVTLVPEMARDAAHVTMLQRSPTYVVSRPAVDRVANWLRGHLPAMLAYNLVRWRNVLFGIYFYNRSRKHPKGVKNFLLNQLRQHLPDATVATHFTPRYNPWDQRLCLVPDADMFEAIKSGAASVETDTIERFTDTGIALSSGKHLDADVIVTATGLKLLFLAGMKVSVDGAPVDFSKCFGYKGMMYSGVPNLATAFGYTNASWTLKADLTSEYVCRLINHMDANGLRQCMPVLSDPAMEEEPWLSFSSGYITRALDQMPKQGKTHPWKLYQNYLYDLFALRFGSLSDPNIAFSKAPPVPANAQEVKAPESAAAE